MANSQQTTNSITFTLTGVLVKEKKVSNPKIILVHTGTLVCTIWSIGTQQNVIVSITCFETKCIFIFMSFFVCGEKLFTLYHIRSMVSPRIFPSKKRLPYQKQHCFQLAPNRSEMMCLCAGEDMIRSWNKFFSFFRGKCQQDSKYKRHFYLTLGGEYWRWYKCSIKIVCAVGWCEEFFVFCPFLYFILFWLENSDKLKTLGWLDWLCAIWFNFNLSVSVCLFLSFSLCLSLTVSLWLCLSLPSFLSVCLALSIFLSFFTSLRIFFGSKANLSTIDSILHLMTLPVNSNSSIISKGIFQ